MSAIEYSAGEKCGRDPRVMSASDFAAAGMAATPVLDAIRAKCIDCSGNNRAEAARCTAIRCALWPFRMGTNPFRAKREMTDEQRAAAASRLARARESKSEAAE